jgi:hypothetical protein
MPEKTFQQALMHLYINIDHFHSYSEAQFEEFELSESERRSLKELLTYQRDGLLLFSELLRKKRRRSILQALPKSRAIVAHQLDALLQAFASWPAPEGAGDGADAVRSFADYLSAQIKGRTEVPEELELVWFEAVCASVSFPPASASIHAGGPHSQQLSRELRLQGGGGVALISCTYDVPAAMNDPSLLGIRNRPSKSYWFFMFKTADGEVRVLAVAPRLAQLIAMLRSGSSVGEVLESVEREADRITATASLEELLRLGAPFFSADELADRDCGSREVSAG